MEDQTDEDFFNNLVDDELEGVGSGSVPRNVTGDLTKVGLDDGHAADGEWREDFGAVPVLDVGQKEGLVTEGNKDMVVPSGEPVVAEKVSSAASSNLVGTGASGSIGGERDEYEEGGIKVLQWSAFSAAADAPELGGLGTFTDFTTDSSGEALFDSKASSTENPVSGTPVTEVSSYFGSLEQDGQEVNVNSTDSGLSYQEDGQQGGYANDPQYWEKLYPGWKYDFNTGQWYEVDSLNSTSVSNIDRQETSVQNDAEVSHIDGTTHLAGEANLDQRSDVSYLQQNSQSVVKTVTESLTMTANLNQVNQERTEYPSNMVFDPQYPEWYYDTNTNEWYSLESYTQSAQLMASMEHNQIFPGDNATSDRLLEESGNSCDYGSHSIFKNQTLSTQTSQEFEAQGGLADSYFHTQVSQHDAVDRSQSLGGFSVNNQKADLFGSTALMGNHLQPQVNFDTVKTVSRNSNDPTMFQGFNPVENTYQFNPPGFEQSQQTAIPHFHDNQDLMGHSPQLIHSKMVSPSQHSYASKEERSSAGRPPHALATFGFGGKLVVMKETCANLALGSQGASGGTISIFNLMDVIVDNNSCYNIRQQSHDYFHALCKQSFPGPLVGGTFATKDLNKWIDERIASCESSYEDPREGELLKLLLSLLKLSYQHYGKLRSPFGSDGSLLETGGPEPDVTKLFADAGKKRGDAQMRSYDSLTSCMSMVPSAGQIQATAAEVQNLLVAGKRNEALQCAQEGLLWGPALVLASQLGEKFYVDTVKQMAHYQLVCGSPLRTLCLLIAGQPADVFSTNNSNTNVPDDMNIASQGIGNGMLDNWEENLAVITANRTKDDELVIIHLGDCLWKERGKITAAHTCYLVADANFESYSDTARLCLVGADHWRCPRTYVSPEAIQRTEFYEYSKVYGNPQYVLQSLQPYKLVYAYMLAEVGKISDSSRYCQAILKLLKNSSHAPEVETWKQLASSLDERLRTHRQGGYGTNLSSAKFVDKIFTTIDRSISRIIGSPPPSASPTFPNNLQSNEHESFSEAPRVINSQSTMAVSSLVPSASVEMISEWTGDNRRSIHSRSASEPNFARSSKQMNPSDGSSIDGQNKPSNSDGSSRLGRFGSQLFQKTVGWVSRSHTGRQAKLGGQNKFYYDEKLKRWVEEGAEPPAEETALPPPPTSFQTGGPDYNINAAFRSQPTSTNDEIERKPSISMEHSPGIPPMPPGQNQFSARGRMGVRSRYVDTFNKGGAPASSFRPPTIPSAKPIVDTSKLFIPDSVPATQSTENSTLDAFSTESGFSTTSSPFSSPPFSSSMQRHPSMDNITPDGNKETGSGFETSNNSYKNITRAASWGGGDFSDTLQNKSSLGEFSPPSALIRHNTPPLQHQGGGPPLANRGSLGEVLHEVEL